MNNPLFLMASNFLLFGIWVGFATPTYSQCRYISTNEKLDATCPEYISECKEHTVESISLSFAIRSNKSAYLIVSHKPYLSSGFHIYSYFGDSFLFLDDESIIKLIHRGNEWSVNGEHFVRYNLTPNEIQKLSKININSIRYTTSSNMEGEVELNNSECERWSRYSGETVIPRTDFPSLITTLLK